MALDLFGGMGAVKGGFRQILGLLNRSILNLAYFLSVLNRAQVTSP